MIPVACQNSNLRSNQTDQFIAECLANMECRLVDVVKKHGIVILEGVKAWIDPKRKERRTIHANGDGTFVVDGRTIDLKEKMVKWKDSL